MNVYLKFEVEYSEHNKEVSVRLRRTGKNKVGPGLTLLPRDDLVGYETFKVRIWHSEHAVSSRIAVISKKMLKDYFRNTKRSRIIRMTCEEFSKERYNLQDSRTMELLKKYGIVDNLE